MKKTISIQKEGFLKILKKVKEVVTKHPVLESLNNILLKVEGNKLKIAATDLIVTVIAELEITNPENLVFDVLLPFEFTSDIIPLLPCIDFNLEQHKKGVIISGQNDKYNLDSLPKVDTFPKLPEFPVDDSLEINADLVQWLTRALSSTSKENVRASMQCVLLNILPESVTIASTNASILFEKSLAIKTDKSASLLVNPKIIKALKGLETTNVSWNKTHIAFQCENMQFIGTLTDDKFPNYKTVLTQTDKSENTSILFNRPELISNIQRAAIADNNISIYLKREIGMLVIEADDSDHNRKITCRMSADYAGACEKINVSASSLLTVLSQVDYEVMNAYVLAAEKPILFKNKEDIEYTSLMMPIA